MSNIEPVYGVLGEWMQSQRAKIDLSLETMARMLRIPVETVERIEKGDIRVLLHTYESIRGLLDDDKLEATGTKARLFFKPSEPVPAKLPSKHAPPRYSNGYSEAEVQALGAVLQPMYLAGDSMGTISTREGLTYAVVRRALKSVGTEMREKNSKFNLRNRKAK